jgi:segregation and condensation protein A
LEHIELMKYLDLEVAGEFILMAATLIQIKVRMLLPRDAAMGEEEEEDPRAELVRQLLEYKRYKEVAESLMDFETRQRRMFPRLYFDWVRPYRKADESSEKFLKDVTLYDLLKAFQSVLDNMPKITAHEVGGIGATVEEQIEFLKGCLEEKDRIGFGEIMAKFTERVVIVVTFLAILELIRTHQIRIQQASIFGEIWILKRQV